MHFVDAHAEVRLGVRDQNNSLTTSGAIDSRTGGCNSCSTITARANNDAADGGCRCIAVSTKNGDAMVTKNLEMLKGTLPVE